MARQRYINTKFWDDNYITKLNPTEKLLFLYFLTNPLTNICGIYEIQLRRISFDTGIEEKQIGEIMKKFDKDKKIYHIGGFLVIKNFTKHQAVNDKIKAGISSILKDIPKEVMDRIKKRDRYLMDTLSIGYGYPLNYVNSNVNVNNNVNPSRDTTPLNKLKSLNDLKDSLKRKMIIK